MTRTVRINPDRLWACLMELEQIGAYDDQATGLRGVRRLALTDADAEARRHCVDWMLQAGLAVRVDRIGNVYATRPGRDRSPPYVLMALTSTPSPPAEPSTEPSACSAASKRGAPSTTPAWKPCATSRSGSSPRKKASGSVPTCSALP